ncbi:MAG: TetR/AcrR family transcriptional regulator [Pseudomonadota bacterium]|nr:TetR/AcrR family transcriptional regulator [Pseudomonadota bacterium]
MQAAIMPGTVQSPIKKRLRAPSRRSLRTRARILDAAERVFAERGFEGATIRDIASLAGVQVGLVHHHGGGKEALFGLVVMRRARDLSQQRLSVLAARKADGPLDLAAVLACFFGPYLEKAASGPQWLAYARIVAHVSADPRWSAITYECFDPTAGVFIDAIAALFPDADRRRIAAGFVYSVSAMLALLTSRWRVDALAAAGPAPDAADLEEALDELVAYCAAGIEAVLS